LSESLLMSLVFLHEQRYLLLSIAGIEGTCSSPEESQKDQVYYLQCP
jgi:hypothetical protein